ncbi:putative DNA-binding transcriptional regulator [compost metagenome]
MSDPSQIKTPKDLSPGDSKGKKRDRSASEERLMCAAIEVFSKHGYDGSTTKMIAAKADINESLIGRYFDGKEGLLLAIVERFINEVCDEALPYEPRDNIEQELIDYVTFKIHTSKQRKNFGKIIICQALTNNSFRKKALEKIPMFHDPSLMSRLENLKTQGKIPADIKVTDVCNDLDNYLHGIFLFELALREVSEAAAVEEAVRFIKHYARGFK